MCGGVILYIHSFLFLVCKGEASYPYSFQVISMPRVGFLKQVRIGKLSVLLAKKKRKKKNRQTGKKKRIKKENCLPLVVNRKTACISTRFTRLQNFLIIKIKEIICKSFSSFSPITARCTYIRVLEGFQVLGFEGMDKTCKLQ